MRYISPPRGPGAYNRRLAELQKIPGITLINSEQGGDRATGHLFTLNTPIGQITITGAEVAAFATGYYISQALHAGEEETAAKELDRLVPDMRHIKKCAADAVAEKA